MKKIFSLVVALLTLVSCSEDFLNLTLNIIRMMRHSLKLKSNSLKQ